ncbi:MAG: hypothetical protein ABSC94_25355 [Polyangiaceae bacterium]
MRQRFRATRGPARALPWSGGQGGQIVNRAPFGSYYASASYGLTGESVDGPYGGVVGAAAAK